MFQRWTKVLRFGTTWWWVINDRIFIFGWINLETNLKYFLNSLSSWCAFTLVVNQLLLWSVDRALHCKSAPIFIHYILLRNILFRVVYKTWAPAAVDFFILLLKDYFFTLLTQRRSPLSIAGNLSYLLMINGQISHTATRVHTSTFKHSLTTAYTSSTLCPKSFVLLSVVINGVCGAVWSPLNF